MNLNMRISVALCTYNGAAYLQQQLNSIAAQTRQPDELIICDDVSSDATLSIAKNFANKVPFSVHVHQNKQNIGSTANFSQAIEYCTSDLIALADQDDVWHRHKLERLSQIFIEDERIALAFSDASITSADLSPQSMTLWQSLHLDKTMQVQLSSNNAFQYLLNKNYVTGALSMFRSSYKTDIIPIPPHWIHDRWIALIIAAQARLALIPEPLILYRQHQHNQVGVGRPSFFVRAIRSLRLNAYDYKIAYEDYENLFNRLQMVDNVDDDNLRLLEKKLQHYQIRANFPSSRFQRVPIILRELSQYKRFSSNGRVSALRDLLG